MDESRPEVRIGDRERREVDERLQRAYADGVLTITEYEERSARCWAARTRSELEPLVLDLPESPGETVATAVQPVTGASAAPTATKTGGHGLGQRLGAGLGIIVLAGAGLWAGSRVAAADDALAVFGSQVTTAGPADDRVEVGVAFGRVEVVVPADARVQSTGALVFGRTECEAACDGSGTRDVVVDAAGAFGSVIILRQGEQLRDDDRDRGSDRSDNNGNNDNNNNNDNDNDDDD